MASSTETGKIRGWNLWSFEAEIDQATSIVDSRQGDDLGEVPANRVADRRTHGIPSAKSRAIYRACDCREPRCATHPAMGQRR